METSPAIESPSPSPSYESGSSFKNVLIILLLAVLILSLLGINIFAIFGDALQNFINIFNPVVSKTLAELGYASGTVIDRSSDIAADTSKTGIDILNGTFHSVGDLLIKGSGKEGPGQALDNHINQPPSQPPHPPQPNPTTNPIQSNASSKSNWCLVGEYNGTRGCISVSDQDKCLSGQVFPSQQQCLNPNLSQNKS